MRGDDGEQKIVNLPKFSARAGSQQKQSLHNNFNPYEAGPSNEGEQKNDYDPIQPTEPAGQAADAAGRLPVSTHGTYAGITTQQHTQLAEDHHAEVPFSTDVQIIRGDTSVRSCARDEHFGADFYPINLERIAVACSSGFPLLDYCPLD